jgi:NADH-quinone oxidoreductase subunit M
VSRLVHPLVLVAARLAALAAHAAHGHPSALLAGTPGERAFPYLTTLVLVPVGTAVLVIGLPKSRQALIRITGFIGSLGALGIAAAVLDQFQAGNSSYQMVSTHPWFGAIGISWTLGVDGISLFLVLLSAVLFPISLAGATERANPKAFTVWMLLLEAACFGSFLSIDVLLFFLFFEVSLVPVYFLIGGWGGEQRGPAATKFFVYTFLGSAFLLVGIVTLAFMHESQTGVLTFDLRALETTHLSGAAGVALFLAFTAAFAVKAPIWPFHTWSPSAYGEAPTGGSVILAGIMAKLGTYGIVRFDLELFPHATVMLAPLLLTLGAVGIIYGAIVAAVQRDLKRLVAFSSLAHIGFIVLGAFALTGQSVSGAVLQMVNHGLYTAALFLLIAMIYRRRGTFDVRKLGGLQRAAPMMAAVFILVVLASIGVPGLNGFVGEFLILIGTFLTHRWWAVAGLVGVVLAAVYLLWAYQQVFHGPPNLSEERPFADLTWREGAVLAPLLVLIVFLGIWPKPVLDRITPSVDALVVHVEQAGNAKVPAAGQPSLTADRGEPSVTRSTASTSAARGRLVSVRLADSEHVLAGSGTHPAARGSVLRATTERATTTRGAATTRTALGDRPASSTPERSGR